MHKLFGLCPSMQTVLSHENQTEGFALAPIQSPEIIGFDISFVTPIYFVLKKMISLDSMLRMLPKTFGTP